MKKMIYLVMALVMVLGFTQCKKEQTPTNNENEGVRITLTVEGGNNNGSKVIVNPTGHTDPNYATVTFENGDIIYVGNNGKYCGYLEHNGTNFSGTVNPESEDDYLHFYFMGNKGAKSEPTSVNITDQTSKYPVISYAHSTKLYSSSTTSYTAKLQNYCAIVKFTTPDISQATAITITGMNNTVTVNFGANNANPENLASGEPYTFSKTGDGNITLHAESNTTRWAILLPKNTATTSTASADGYTPNGTFTVPLIAANTYHSTGISVEMTAVFSVGASTKVLFAPGNLQAVYAAANTSSCTWQFAPTQYSIIGNATANTAVGNNVVTTAGTVDLFGWVGKSSDLAAYGINNNNNQWDYGFQNDESLKSDWGVVANAANLGGHNDWRTLTNAEWGYLLTERPNANQKLGLGGIIAGSTAKGLIILPDNWTLPEGLGFTSGCSSWANNYYTAAQWEKMEKNGAVFLPATGYRENASVNFVNSYGYYWSSTAFSNGKAYFLVFWEGGFNAQNNYYRYRANSVRLARDVD